jgi:hypothetical protein
MTPIHPDGVGDPTPEAALERHANAIKALGKRAAKDMIEIGYHLTQAKLLCGHGHWLRWLDRPSAPRVTSCRWLRASGSNRKPFPI